MKPNSGWVSGSGWEWVGGQKKCFFWDLFLKFFLGGGCRDFLQFFLGFFLVFCMLLRCFRAEAVSEGCF